MTAGVTYPGRLHQISRRNDGLEQPLVAFEHVNSDSVQQRANTIIFLAGLFDGLLTVPYVSHLVSALNDTWTLVEPILKSAYKQSGISSLDEGVAEVAQLVTYFRRIRPGGKIVVLGHSTGSQLIMHYLLSEHATKAKIDGGLMQGGVSDREALVMSTPPEDYWHACTTATSYLQAGKPLDILPSACTSSFFGSAPISARRWLSLASPGPEHQGQDDYFSSDLSEERLENTFSRMGGAGTRLAFLYGSQDQYVPPEIDKQDLVSKWESYVRKGGGLIDPSSGIVEGASHTLKEGGQSLKDLVLKVVEFLERVEYER